MFSISLEERNSNIQEIGFVLDYVPEKNVYYNMNVICKYKISIDKAMRQSENSLAKIVRAIIRTPK